MENSTNSPKNIENTSTSTTSTNTRPSLDFRLRQKLRELNETHQKTIKNYNQVNQEINKITEEKTALPLRQVHVEQEIGDLTRKAATLQKEIDNLEQEIVEWKNKEINTIEAHRPLRQQILTEICQDDEKDIVEDTIDVKVAEIRRQIKKRTELRQEGERKRSEISAQMTELEQLITPEKLLAAKENLQTRLEEKLQEQKKMADARETAGCTLHECQKLLDDLQERQTLETYAKENGLSLKEKTSTTELIQVCRTHQEKIAAKNAAVDSDNPLMNRPPNAHPHTRPPPPLPNHQEISVSDESDNEHHSSLETCDCSHCREWSTTSMDSVHYFRVQEANRRQDGLTVAGAINTRQRRQTRQEHGENGWCNHW
jgi:chromosome segregation ATPase